MAPVRYMPTRVGMLLFDTSGGHVWVVKSKTKLIRIAGGVIAEATLSKGCVPPHWKIIDADKLGRLFAQQSGASVGQDLSFLLSDPIPVVE